MPLARSSLAPASPLRPLTHAPSIASSSTLAIRPPPHQHVHSQRRHASNATRRAPTRARADMWRWLRDQGEQLKVHHGNEPTYLSSGRGGGGNKDAAAGHRPFPENPFFLSQPVLSPRLRQEIYKAVLVQRCSVREVSQAFGVDMHRVAAVVRLMALEREAVVSSKPTARPYADAILAMLPQTTKVDLQNPHEPINALSVHRATLPQLFVPVAESREFTRRDAGRAFNAHLRPADERIPHPDMIQTAHDAAEGLSVSARAERQRQRWADEQTARDAAKTRARARDAANKTVVRGARFDFVFRGMDTEAVSGKTGWDGRGVDGRAGSSAAEGGILSGKMRGMGKKAGEPWRYGAPLTDRKKGMVKIPVEVV